MKFLLYNVELSIEALIKLVDLIPKFWIKNFKEFLETHIHVFIHLKAHL